tara:strand:+ start:32 stop:580 length:549 start_codon:yes stop_codon:yes gene_type:complete
MASIFDTVEWVTGSDYEQYDFVYRDQQIGVSSITTRRYYYARNQITDSTTAPENDSTNWFGFKQGVDGVDRPHFDFIASYNNQVNTTPRVNVVQFGDGYEVRRPDGLHSNLLILNLAFDTRSEKEATAILHFLKERNSIESFLYTAPNPYNLEKIFVCRQWQSTNNFFDNHTVNCVFNEVPN